jgi:putative DNA primase/helicase
MKHIVLLAENDEANGKALAQLIPALKGRGVRVDVARPPAGLKDMNDLVNGTSGHSAKDGLAAVKAAIERALAGEPDPVALLSAGPDGRAIIPSPGEPMRVARQFLEQRHLHHDGTPTLRYWQGAWWIWKTVSWREVLPRLVTSRLYAFTEDAAYRADGGELKAWSPTHRKIADLIEALGAICIVLDDVDQPCWLDGRESGSIVALANGLLELKESGERRLLPHSPLFFNQTSVPFAYDPGAPPPEHWLKFLDELWPETKAETQALGEWFGYVISGRLDQHKILLIIGPTRGGKGVIARILTALIGKSHVAGPTLNSLGGDFGLAPLIGKSLAIISDARFGGRDDSAVVERLLSISGEDTLTANRKYREAWTGKLSCRLHIMSNELPRLNDASAAVIGRLVVLPLTRSWLGREDKTLERKFSAELSGILNWSLDGLARLDANGNAFTEVASADQAIEQLRDLASPVAAFVREECVIGKGCEIRVDDLYRAFKTWADDSGQPRKSKSVFGRNLKAAIPMLRTERPRAKDNPGPRARVYIGLDLASNHSAPVPDPFEADSENGFETYRGPPGPAAENKGSPPVSDPGPNPGPDCRARKDAGLSAGSGMRAAAGPGYHPGPVQDAVQAETLDFPRVVQAVQENVKPFSISTVIDAAAAAGARLVLSEDRTVFTVEWRGPYDPLVADALKDNYDAVLDWLRREADVAFARARL